MLVPYQLVAPSDDGKYLAMPTLRHRVVLAPGAEIEGLGVDQVIGQIVDRIAAPR